MTDVVTPSRFDRARLALLADWITVCVAVSLPWSTSATDICILVWLLVLLPTLNAAALRRELDTAAGGLPVALWFLAALGMLWADVSWSERINGLGGFHRLLMVPLLLAQFRRSQHEQPGCCMDFFAPRRCCCLCPGIGAASRPRLARQNAGRAGQGLYFPEHRIPDLRIRADRARLQQGTCSAICVRPSSLAPSPPFFSPTLHSWRPAAPCCLSLRS